MGPRHDESRTWSDPWWHAKHRAGEECRQLERDESHRNGRDAQLGKMELVQQRCGKQKQQTSAHGHRRSREEARNAGQTEARGQEHVAHVHVRVSPEAALGRIVSRVGMATPVTTGAALGRRRWSRRLPLLDDASQAHRGSSENVLDPGIVSVCFLFNSDYLSTPFLSFTPPRLHSLSLGLSVLSHAEVDPHGTRREEPR